MVITITIFKLKFIFLSFTLQFSDNFFNYEKIWFHVNGVNNCFNILCIFLPFPSDVNLYSFDNFFETKID